jgi:immunoglobulin-binding protein 1
VLLAFNLILRDQGLLQSALADLQELAKRVDALSLFSANETLEDISDRHLVYLLVPFVFAEVISRLQASGNDQRLNKLRQAQVRI